MPTSFGQAQFGKDLDRGPAQVGAGSLRIMLTVFGLSPEAPGRLSYPPGSISGFVLLWRCFCRQRLRDLFGFYFAFSRLTGMFFEIFRTLKNYRSTFGPKLQNFVSLRWAGPGPSPAKGNIVLDFRTEDRTILFQSFEYF